MIPPAVRALFRNTPTIAPVPNRAILSVTGSDAKEFLNGIVASTVPSSPEHHFYTAFLHAQGRVLHDAFAYSHVTPAGKNGYLIEYDASSSEAPLLLSALKRFVLRAKVRLRDVTEEYDVWAAWGSEKEKLWETERHWQFARSGAIEPDWTAEQTWPWGHEPYTIQDRRSVGMGHRLLVKKGERPFDAATHDLATADDYTLHRILHGVPEGVTDIIPTHAFPMDSNLDFMGALDFRKGCYVGQELTVRTFHTGILRKRTWPVLISPSTQPNSPDTPIPPFPPHLDIRPRIAETDGENPVKVRPRGTGKLLSTVGNVGLALLRVQQAKMAEKGHINLEFDTKNDNAEVSTWTVRHWRPEGMPEIPDETEM